jgi:hypothetical protein
MLKGINLAHFPENRTHYLAYALQFGLKIPSVKTMNRCERRNRVKAGSDKADKITGKVQVIRVGKLRRPFKITTRYIDKEAFGVFGGRRRRFIRGKKNENKAKKVVDVGPKRVISARNSISLPAEIV